MKRRDLLTMAAAGSMAGILAAKETRAQERVERATRGTPSPKIKDISVIATQPGGVRLIVVKITTDQDGLYGYGCATFTQRADLVVPAVEKYLRPLLVGRPADRIEDTWQMCYNSSYWRNGPVLNNAISGVDQALWDIKGRQAGMPVYQLLGGKCREAAASYTSIGGNDVVQIVEGARKAMAQGYRHIRLQISVPGMSGYGAGGGGAAAPKVQALHNDPVYEPGPYIRRTVKMLEECRKQLGDEIELLHDIHERVSPREAVQFAKDVEPLKLFFLEDAFSPEDIAYFRQIRQQCTTPLAMGELFNSPHEWITAHLRAADRLHPHPHLAGRRPHALPEDRAVRRALRREDRLAWTGRCVSHRAHVQPAPRPGEPQFRRAGGRRDPGCGSGDLQEAARPSRTAISTPMTRRGGASRSTRSWLRSTRSGPTGRAGA